MAPRGTIVTTSRESDRSKPRKSRLRPLALWGCLAAVLLVLAALGLRQVALGADVARREVTAELSALTGLPVEANQGRAAFQLLPVPRIALRDVRVGAAGPGPLLSIDRMTADLDLWSALFGHARIERLVLDEPDLVAPATPVPALRRPGGWGPGTLGPILARLHGLGEVEIRNGVLRRETDGAPIVSAAHLSLSWPAESASAELAGSYAWNGQPVTLSIDLAKPLAWMDGAASHAEVMMSSPQLAVAFAGEASSAGRLSGRLTASLPSLGRALRWLTGSRLSVPEIGPLALAADLTSEEGRLHLADATVSIDEFAGNGALDLVVAEGRRPSLSGTLAFARLDLDGIADALAPKPATPLEATRAIPTDFVDRMDIDLRVSAKTGQIGPLALSGLAGTVKMKDGMATLDIGDAGLLGGSGQMRVGIDTQARPPSLKGSASMRGVEVSGLLSTFGLDPAALTGTADVAFDAEAPVTNWADMLGRHRLKADVSARSGMVSGLDPQILKAAGRSDFVPGASGASLPFSALKAEVAIRGSRMELRSLSLASEIGTIAGTGFLLDGAEEADLAGTFDPAPIEATASPLTKPKPLAMTMRGSWPHPVVVTTAEPGGE
jgi:AsmA protein